MSTFGDDFRESRRRRQEYRASLVECWRCGTKNGPEAERCRTCGEANENYRPEKAKKGT